MASANVTPPCDLCESANSDWRCGDCQIYLCELCKEVHQREPKTRNDTINPIDQVQVGIQRNRTPVSCDLHKTNVGEFYCYTCEKFICTPCLSNEHKMHSFDCIDNLVDSKMSELNDIEENLESKLTVCDTVFDIESKNHEDYMSHIDQMEKQIMEQTDKIVKEFYRLRNKQLSELVAQKVAEDRKYENRCNERQSCLNDIRKTIDSVQKAKVSGDVDLMNAVLQESTHSYQSLEDPTMSSLPRPEFERNQNFDPPQFLQLQGRLNIIQTTAVPNQMCEAVPFQQTEEQVPHKPAIDMNNVKVNTKVQLNDDEPITTILPTANNMAWIAVGPGKHLSLIDLQGRTVKTSAKVDDGIFDSVEYDENILVVHDRSHCVMRFSKDEESVTIFSDLSPFYTNGICVTSQNDVIVSLVSALTFSDDGSKLTSKLVRLDKQGKVVQEIQYRDQEPLFSAPMSVASLPSGDVVVVDNVEPLGCRLVCVDGSGNLRYTFDGEIGGRKVDNFTLTDMTHDDQNVYVTDIVNNCVYVVDSNGKAEQFLLEKLGIINPVAISMDNAGKMWIGCKSNIYVLE